MGKLFLFESDVILANRMGFYWSETEEKGFEHEIYTSEGKFFDDISSIEADVWLMDEAIYERFLAIHKRGIALKFTKQVTEDSDSIFKYQSMERLNDIISELLGVKRESQSSSIRCKLYSVYSPSNCMLETTISMELAQVFSKRAKTLYIYLKPYSDLERRTHQVYNKDICDLLLYLEQCENLSMLQLAPYISVFAGVDMLVAPSHIEHLIAVSEEEWLKLLQKLGKIYDYILIELSNSIRGLYAILNRMDCIITFIPYGEVYEGQFNTYWDNLECLCEKRIKEHTKEYFLEEHLSVGDYNSYTQYMKKYQMLEKIISEVEELA